MFEFCSYALCTVGLFFPGDGDGISMGVVLGFYPGNSMISNSEIIWCVCL